MKKSGILQLIIFTMGVKDRLPGGHPDASKGMRPNSGDRHPFSNAAHAVTDLAWGTRPRRIGTAILASALTITLAGCTAGSGSTEPGSTGKASPTASASAEPGSTGRSAPPASEKPIPRPTASPGVLVQSVEAFAQGVASGADVGKIVFVGPIGSQDIQTTMNTLPLYYPNAKGKGQRVVTAYEDAIGDPSKNLWARSADSKGIVANSVVLEQQGVGYPLYLEGPVVDIDGVNFLAPSLAEFVVAGNNNSGVVTTAKLDQMPTYYKGRDKKDAQYKKRNTRRPQI